MDIDRLEIAVRLDVSCLPIVSYIRAFLQRHKKGARPARMQGRAPAPGERLENATKTHVGARFEIGQAQHVVQMEAAGVPRVRAFP